MWHLKWDPKNGKQKTPSEKVASKKIGKIGNKKAKSKDDIKKKCRDPKTRRKKILVKNWHLWKNDGDQKIGSKKVNWMEMTPEQNDWDHKNGKQKTPREKVASDESVSWKLVIFLFFSCGSRLPGENATLASFRVQGYQMKRQATFFFSGPSIVAGYQVKTREFQGGLFILP